MTTTTTIAPTLVTALQSTNPPRCTCVTRHNDFTLVATGNTDGSLNIWQAAPSDALPQTPPLTLHTDQQGINAIASRNSTLVTASDSRSVCVYKFSYSASDKIQLTLAHRLHHASAVLNVLFTSTPHMLVTATTDTVSLYSLQSLRLINSIHLPSTLTSLCTVPTQTTPKAVHVAVGCADGSIYLYDVEHTLLLQTLQNSFADSAPTTLSFNAAQQRLYATYSGDEVASFEIKPRTQRSIALQQSAPHNAARALHVNKSAITCANHHPLNPLLYVIGDASGHITLWYTHSDTITPLVTVESHAHAIVSVTFDTSGTQLYAACEDALISVWRLPDILLRPTAELARFAQRASREVVHIPLYEQSTLASVPQPALHPDVDMHDNCRYQHAHQPTTHNTHVQQHKSRHHYQTKDNAIIEQRNKDFFHRSQPVHIPPAITATLDLITVQLAGISKALMTYGQRLDRLDGRLEVHEQESSQQRFREFVQVQQQQAVPATVVKTTAASKLAAEEQKEPTALASTG